jgi:hypothetical protein
MSDPESRRRWVSFGELIALAALIVSGVGVWIAWKSTNEDKPTRVVEQRPSVALALRGSADRDGGALTILPADPAHALESLTVTIKDRDKDPKDVTQRVPVRIDARYVEAGTERRGGGAYTLRYKWEGGGLFGGRSLRLVGLSR